MSSPIVARETQLPFPTRPTRRTAFTLLEILISTAVTLIMIFAILEIFEQVSGGVALGRASIEMSGQIRVATFRLQEDLRAITVPVRPWPKSSSNEGYFEYLEGPGYDAFTLPANTIPGDVDDVLMFTSRSVQEPYVGRFGGITLESQVAEIIWWTRPTAGNELTLHRRALLVRPDLGTVAGPAVGGAVQTTLDLQAFFNNNDLSVRLVGGNIIANTLADLTKRENRFAHNTAGFPFPIDVNSGNPLCLNNLAQTGLQQGNDVVLSHMQAFDVRAFDPTAQIRNDGNRALVPSDPGWGAGANIGLGAFVDLNYSSYAGAANSSFSGPVNGFSQLPMPCYDTWSFHYEHNGIDEDGGFGVAWRVGADQGTDGIDNNNNNGPDDVFERETSPPYPIPLRGIQIKLRIEDHDSRQIREATVVHDFIPE